MKHYGDVNKINGAEIEPVDIITFGSPCQDLSVAGKRAGIQDGERSNLFFEAIRIIKEMREATNDEYPKYAVWENVPGAFSSNKGHDFHAVLEAFCSVCDGAVSIPKPYDKKRTDKLVWSKAGEIVGNNYSIAWRTLDAQYWGVPQRRKRIYLVADFTGRRAGEILFKPESLRGDIAKSNEAGQGITADAVGSVDRSAGVECLNPWDAQNEPVIAFTQNQREEVRDLGDKAGALAAEAGVHQQTYVAQPVIALQANGIDRADTVDRHAVCFDRATFNQGINAQYDFEVSEEGVVSTVVARGPSGVCYDARGNGDGETACYTMQRSDEYQACEVASTQSARQYKSATDLVVEKQYLFENHSQDTRYKGPLDVSPIVSATFGMGGNNQPFVIQEEKPPRKYIIRRLTPTECARLQGFPDWWSKLAPYNPADAEFWEDVRKTHAEINGKKYKPTKNLKKWYEGLHTDSAEYKMWGNGIALPNTRYVIQGIAGHGAKTLGSLFDGSGGFPLAGMLNGIKLIWASEVEPYPIAVTKSRFKATQEELEKVSV